MLLGVAIGAIYIFILLESTRLQWEIDIMFAKIANSVRWRSKSVQRYICSLKEKLYDLRMGTDTANQIQVCDLDIENRLKEEAVRYQATKEKNFHCVISKLPIQYERFAFFDFGSGKGKVLIMAHQCGFRDIYGIEASKYLNVIAKDNIKKSIKNGHSIKLICMDASLYHLPPIPSVYYFYNPFKGKILKKVIHNITMALENQFSEAYIIYMNSHLAEMFLETGKFKVFSQGQIYRQDYCIFTTVRSG